MFLPNFVRLVELLYMNDFLQQLRCLKAEDSSRLHEERKREYRADVFFLIEGKPDGVYLSVVDESLNPVDVDYRYFTGDTAQMLHSLENVLRERRFQIVWDDEPQSIKLNEHPYLCFQLARCPHVVDKQGQPISFHEEKETLKLDLLQHDQTFYPQFSLNGNVLERGELEFLSDCFVWVDKDIYEIHSLGNNYRLVQAFKDPIAVDMLDKYLSVFYSHISHVDVSVEGYELSISDREVEPKPTLVFEKVDADKTLYLRVADSVDGMHSDFIDQFDINRMAHRVSEHEIEIYRLKRRPLDAVVESVYDDISRHMSRREAKKKIYTEGHTLILPEEVAGPFLLNALPSLIRKYRIVGAEKLKEYKVSAVKPSLKLSLSSGIDFLEGNAHVDLGGDSFTLLELFTQYNSKKYVQLSDGNRAVLDDAYMRRLERIFRKIKKSDKDKVKVSFFDLSELENLVDGSIEGEAFKHHRSFYEGFNHLRADKLKVPALKAKLRPYQKEGVKWIKYLYDNHMGGCLADDMGLGKTLQTIGVLNLIYPQESKPTLLVMPRSLLFNWQNEISRFSPQLKVYTYYGTTRDMEEALKHQLILTTYAIVRNDIEQFKEQEFHYVILDESQNIKNVATQSTQAIYMLKAEHRLALSGTPIENNLSELYSLFRFLNPTMFGTMDDFNVRYANPIQKDGDKDAMQSLRRKIFPFMLRRLKKDVLKDLPDRTDKVLYVEMDEMQARFYDQRRQYYKQQVEMSIHTEGIQKSQFVMFQALSELRRIASVPESLTDGQIHSPKLEALTESLLEAVANGHKTVVFFNFIAGMELLSETLEANGIDHVCMTGSTHDRKSIVERFQNDARCKVMLMTLKTGGVGLNLTAADTVYIFEPWWNKAAEEQAINRLHRFGQKAKVLCYSLITRDTIEEKIQLLQQQKADLFKGLIGADASSAKHLSEDDINFILG